MIGVNFTIIFIINNNYTSFCFVKSEQRVEILTKLISMAVALQCSPVLECSAVWMQVNNTFSL